MGRSTCRSRGFLPIIIITAIFLALIVFVPKHYVPTLPDSVGEFVWQHAPAIHLDNSTEPRPEPGYESPIVEDLVDDTVPEQPVAEGADAAQPVVEEADAAQPVVEEADAAQPVAEEADAEQPEHQISDPEDGSIGEESEETTLTQESRPKHTISAKRPPHKLPHKPSHSVAKCASAPPAEEFLISMKTGATELYAKLPEQLLTTLRCVPNYMLFSDLEQDVGQFHIYSSLEEVSDKYKYSHRDFEFYRKLMDLSAKGQDLSLLKATKQAAGSSWELDKWKFVPITHRVYKEQPDIPWYIFIEADSYFAWPNILELLSHYDPDDPWYLGAVHFLNDLAFGHGGMGYIISNGAMRLMDEIYDSAHIAAWERRIADGCCGDVELAAVLQEAGVNITGIPGLFAESLSWFEWDEGRWCEPSISWHHVRAHDVEVLWQFEAKWKGGNGSHYVYRDLFNHLVEPHLTKLRHDWDNMSRHRIHTGISGVHGDEERRYKQETKWEDLNDGEKEDRLKDLDEEQLKMVDTKGKYIKDTRWDELSEREKQNTWDELTDVEKVAHESLDHCQKACHKWNECVQWFFMPGRCHLNRNIRLGHYVQMDENEGEDNGDAPQSTSGWMRDRVDAFRTRMAERGCKSVPEWMDEYAEDELSKELS